MLTLLILATLALGLMVYAAWRTTDTRQAQRAARLRYLAYSHRHERSLTPRCPCWRCDAAEEEHY